MLRNMGMGNCDFYKQVLLKHMMLTCTLKAHSVCRRMFFLPSMGKKNHEWYKFCILDLISSLEYKSCAKEIWSLLSLKDETASNMDSLHSL